MKIFITGASGFVGNAAAQFLVEKGHEVYAMSRSQAADNLIEKVGAIPVRCNVENIEAMHFKDCSLLIHAAAFVGEWGNYETYHKINVLGTERLLTEAKKSSVRKFIHISTEAVLFAGQDLVNVDESQPYIDTPFYYAKTKQLAEKAVVQAHKNGEFETICLRPRMIWGPGDKTILPLMKDAVLNNKFMWINHGNYNCSTTYIKNLVHAINLTIENSNLSPIYFITDDETHKLKDFCTRLLQTQSVNPANKSIPKWLARTAAFFIEKAWHLLRLKSRPPITRFGAAIFSAHCTINISKAKKELGYLPVISVAEGLQELVKEQQ